MSILEKIKSDSLAARKAAVDKERAAVVRSSLLQTLLGEATRVGKDATPPRDTTDEEVLAVIRKFKKNAEETLSHVDDAVTIGSIEVELAVLNGYLPTELSPTALRDALKGYGETLGRPLTVKDTGTATAALNDQYPGQVTSKAVSALLRETV